MNSNVTPCHLDVQLNILKNTKDTTCCTIVMSWQRIYSENTIACSQYIGGKRENNNLLGDNLLKQPHTIIWQLANQKFKKSVRAYCPYSCFYITFIILSRSCHPLLWLNQDNWKWQIGKLSELLSYLFNSPVFQPRRQPVRQAFTGAKAVFPQSEAGLYGNQPSLELNASG